MNDVEAMRDLLSRLDKIKDWDKLIEMMTPEKRRSLLEALQKNKP